MKIQQIYNMIDGYAPFSLQESWDRSGLLVGSPQAEATSVMLTLDITVPVVYEAKKHGAQLIISHHPVIWEPLRTISHDHPVWHLVRHQIGAICAHTNLDIAKGGLNDYIGRIMRKYLPLSSDFEPLSPLSGERALGRAAALGEAFEAKKLAYILQRIFHCRSMRYYEGAHSQYIRKIAWCSGSGGDLISDAISVSADALITGDCKHSVWAEAQNRSFTLFDCGHFETEVPVVRLLSRILMKNAPQLQINISRYGTEPYFRTI